jgi:prohibitin 1
VKSLIAFIIILFIGAGGALTGCTQIDTGNVGVEQTFGQVKPESQPPSLYFTLFKTMHEATAKEQPIDLNDMQPKAKDNITLQDVDVTIYYKIAPQHAARIMIKYAGDMAWNKDAGGYNLAFGLVRRVTREAVYQAMAMHNASEVHVKRAEIGTWTREAIQRELDADAGKGFFEITNVVIRNIVTDPRLEEAIKQSAEIEFTIRKKNQELELARKEAERRLIEAEGEARANRAIADSLTPSLIELRRIEGLSSFAKQGTHTVVVPSGATPLIQAK